MRQGLKLALAPVAWRVLRAGIRLAGAPAPGPDDPPVIFACLHRDILPAIMYVRPARPTLLVSRSPDGEILLRTLGRRDYGFVRGATGEDGQRAFGALRRELQAGHSIGLAVDGPKGPYGVVNEGVLQLSRLCRVPIVALRAEPEHALVLRTWDRTVVPRPGSRVVIRRREPLVVPRDGGEAELAGVRRDLRGFFGVEEADHAHP